MNERDWYEVVSGSALQQGDLLFRCPVFLVDGQLQWPLPAGQEVNIKVHVTDLIVLTQSCDLVNDKVKEVLLARVVPWAEAVKHEVEKGNEAAKGSKFRKLLLDGNIPSMSLLHKREPQPSVAWSVVDFHKLYPLPKDYLSQYAASVGQRLRLRSPYREHLAQAFARFFMRVGLPHEAKAFEKEGEVKV